MMQQLSILLLIIFLIGCTPQRINTPEPTSLPSTAGEAQQTLINFFALLNAEKYAAADSLYGGSYEQLQVFNPDAAPSDHAAL